MKNCQVINLQFIQCFKDKVEESGLLPNLIYNADESIEILDPPTTTIAKIKPDTAFNFFNTYITLAKENCASAKDIIFLRNLREKAFKQGLKITKKTLKDYFKTN